MAIGSVEVHKDIFGSNRIYGLRFLTELIADESLILYVRETRMLH